MDPVIGKGFSSRKKVHKPSEGKGRMRGRWEKQILRGVREYLP